MKICTKCDSPRIIVTMVLYAESEVKLLNKNLKGNIKDMTSDIEARVCMDCSNIELYATKIKNLV